MKTIKPMQLTDDILIDTNIHEVAPAEYVMETIYSAGAFVHINNNGRLDIYESLQENNTEHPPETSPDWWVYRSFTYPEYKSNESYSKGEKVVYTPRHQFLESLQDNNTGKIPEESPKWWLPIGSTAPWIPFDEKVGSQTKRTGTIEYKIKTDRVEGIAFFNINANKIEVSLIDENEEELFFDSVELTIPNNVFDLYSYFFADFLKLKNYAFIDIPVYYGATLNIKIIADYDSSTVACGEIVFGRVMGSGITQYSPTVEILDRSIKEEDDFGNFIIVKRPFKKRVSFEVILDNYRLGPVQDFFEQNRAIPIVYLPAEEGELLTPYLVYGFYSRFEIVTRYPKYSIIDIEIIGLA